ncbi:MAG: FAD-dependent oxidoreductase, partial [Spirochaetes bacterium]|nr:FAD-dependent oxidoreductase [Spirochaetota bacterium]
MDKRDIIILGSGPAGLTSAIYSSRAGYKPLVIEGLLSGGQLMITTEIENFPGFPDGISGPDLMEKMKKQAEKYGAEFITADATKVELKKRPFKIYTDEKEFEAKALIIATGARAKYLDNHTVEALKGKGVSACATCDGFFFKNKTVYVIGGGDTAAEEALFLTKHAKEVFLVHRRDELRASKYMQEKLFNNPKITI